MEAIVYSLGIMKAFSFVRECDRFLEQFFFHVFKTFGECIIIVPFFWPQVEVPPFTLSFYSMTQ